MTANELCFAIFNKAGRLGYTDRRLSESCGIGINTPANFRNSHNVQLDTLLKMTEELGLEITIKERNVEKYKHPETCEAAGRCQRCGGKRSEACPNDRLCQVCKTDEAKAAEAKRRSREDSEERVRKLEKKRKFDQLMTQVQQGEFGKKAQKRQSN